MTAITGVTRVPAQNWRWKSLPLNLASASTIAACEGCAAPVVVVPPTIRSPGSAALAAVAKPRHANVAAAKPAALRNFPLNPIR